MLITANHVFETMPRDRVLAGFRELDAAGVWRYQPVKIRIWDAEGAPLWTRHPTQDVAAIELPAGLARSALADEELGGERALETLGVAPATR